ncbi:MAG: hypothetical protein HYX92_20750 [Chloroflexi bacterium]|nr:hypothetical protein [Chloroflexota bacterium]
MTIQQENRIETLEVLDPVAPVVAKTIPPARRLRDLNGRKIGLYSNTKPGADDAVAEAARLLQARFQNLSFETFWSKPPHEPGFLEKAAQSGCDAIIASTAD